MKSNLQYILVSWWNKQTELLTICRNNLAAHTALGAPSPTSWWVLEERATSHLEPTLQESARAAPQRGTALLCPRIWPQQVRVHKTNRQIPRFSAFYTSLCATPNVYRGGILKQVVWKSHSKEVRCISGDAQQRHKQGQLTKSKSVANTVMLHLPC